MNKLVRILLAPIVIPVGLIYYASLTLSIYRMGRKIAKSGTHKLSIGNGTVRIQANEDPSQDKPFAKNMDVLMGTKICGSLTVKGSTPEELDKGIQEVGDKLKSFGLTLADHV